MGRAVWEMATRSKTRLVLAASLLFLLVVSLFGLSCMPSGEGDATRENWDRAVALVDQGRAAEEAGKPSEALALYSQAISTEPGFASGWGSKVCLLLEQGKFAEALQTAEGYSQSLPSNSSSWFYKGYALEGLGRYQEAIVEYQKSMALDAKNGRATDGTASRVAHCQDVLGNQANAEDQAYYDTAATLISKVRGVNQSIETILAAMDAEEVFGLLSMYGSGVQGCSDDAAAAKVPDRLASIHAQLLEGLGLLKAGALGVSAALQAGDSAAFSRSFGTLFAGSDKVEAYRLAMLDELGK